MIKVSTIKTGAQTVGKVAQALKGSKAAATGTAKLTKSVEDAVRISKLTKQLTKTKPLATSLWEQVAKNPMAYNKKIKKINTLIEALPNVKEATFSLGQLKLMASMVGKKAKGHIKDLIKQIEKTVGKKATVTLSKEASKTVKGGTVVRATVKNGENVFAKYAAVIDNSGKNPIARAGCSVKPAGLSAYSKFNGDKLTTSVVDDLAVSVSQEGTTVAAKVKAGEALSGGFKIDFQKLGEYAGKITPGFREQVGADFPAKFNEQLIASFKNFVPKVGK